MSTVMSRRELLVLSACLAGTAALKPLFAQAHAATPFSCVAADPRLCESGSFASAIGTPDVHALDMTLDLCRQWYGGLRDTVLDRRGSIAGMTTWIDFEVMRGLARESGMQLQFQGDHKAINDSHVEHTFSQNDGLLSSLHDVGDAWPSAIGGWLRGNANSLMCRSDGTCSSVTRQPTPQKMQLVSWVFGARGAA